MRATASTEAQAATANITCMNFSVHAFDFILFYYLIPSNCIACVNVFYLIAAQLICCVVFIHNNCDTVCCDCLAVKFVFLIIL